MELGMNSTTFKTHAAAVLKAAGRSWQVIEALKEQCPHPKDKITWSKDQTVCECGEVLWRKGGSYWSRETKRVFSPYELSNPRELLIRLTGKREEAKRELAEVQSKCQHTEGKTYIGDMEEVCATCHIDWFKTEEGERDLVSMRARS